MNKWDNKLGYILIKCERPVCGCVILIGGVSTRFNGFSVSENTANAASITTTATAAPIAIDNPCMIMQLD